MSPPQPITPIQRSRHTVDTVNVYTAYLFTVQLQHLLAVHHRTRAPMTCISGPGALVRTEDTDNVSDCILRSRAACHADLLTGNCCQHQTTKNHLPQSRVYTTRATHVTLASAGPRIQLGGMYPDGSQGSQSGSARAVSVATGTAGCVCADILLTRDGCTNSMLMHVKQQLAMGEAPSEQSRAHTNA